MQISQDQDSQGVQQSSNKHRTKHKSLQKTNDSVKHMEWHVWISCGDSHMNLRGTRLCAQGDAAFFSPLTVHTVLLHSVQCSELLLWFRASWMDAPIMEDAIPALCQCRDAHVN